MAISIRLKQFSKIFSAGAAAAVIGISTPTHAYTIFFGEDLNNSPCTPLSSFTNAQTAEANFRSTLGETGVETFESFAAGSNSPVTFTLPRGQRATLNGSGFMTSVTPGRTNGVGRYAISGSNYWEANADWGQFWITFNQPVAAFGFYGIDIGDFGGNLMLHLTDSTGRNRQLTVSNTMGSSGNTDGSVLYYGMIADNRDEYFTSVLFNMSTGEGDFFAFDNMTVGSIQEPIPTRLSIPEPASILEESIPEPASILEESIPETASTSLQVSIPEPASTSLQVSIPEPSSVLSVMALGAIGAGSLLLRQQQHK